MMEFGEHDPCSARIAMSCMSFSCWFAARIGFVILVWSSWKIALTLGSWCACL
jgi:hypothetical protein